MVIKWIHQTSVGASNEINKWISELKRCWKVPEFSKMFTLCRFNLLRRSRETGMVFVIISELSRRKILTRVFLLLLPYFVNGFRLRLTNRFLNESMRSSLIHFYSFHLLVLLKFVFYLLCLKWLIDLNIYIFSQTYKHFKLHIKSILVTTQQKHPTR